MTHFSLALLILCVITWLWLSLRNAPRPPVKKGRRTAILLLGLVFLQMAAGALVAGLDAGRSYNDWPLMAGELVPSHYIQADLGIRSFFEGRAATQFNHRFLAYVLWGLSLWAAWRYRGGALARPFAVLAALVSAQAVWGILTLLNAAPLTLALVHQGLGVIVTLAAVYLAWRAAAPVTPSPAQG
jgi:cytochrome c oxidase assembly protein subunit 15